jgi:YHS domain-containing protein
MICAKCKKSFNGEPPKYLKDLAGRKVTLVFCSEECMDAYKEE